jgi:flagella basal body P-ring formation protein FlgA
MNRLHAAILSLVVLFGQPALAATDEAIQDPESIRETARQFAAGMAAAERGAARVEVGALDRRLRLPQCDKPLSAHLSPSSRNASRQSIGVRCEGAVPWSLFVPVTIERPAQVVVTARPVPRGQVITGEDVKLAERDLNTLHRGYLTDPAQAVGQLAERDLPGDEELVPGNVGKPNAIKRGAEITIMAADELLDVRVSGVALASGGIGERIRVRNASSKREFDAVVVGDGLVQVSP